MHVQVIRVLKARPLDVDQEDHPGGRVPGNCMRKIPDSGHEIDLQMNPGRPRFAGSNLNSGAMPAVNSSCRVRIWLRYLRGCRCVGLFEEPVNGRAFC